MKIYNTLTKQKEDFKPINGNDIGMYVCGVTVYDDCHIGHARAYLCFDVIIRHLKLKGYNVNYVRNITDIDDKIIKRAKETNQEFNAVTTKYIKSMHDDFKALNILEPNQEPRATEYMPQMIKLISELEEKGFAYQADNGDVYYSVQKFDNYGRLSKRNLEDMQAGARIDVNDQKKYPLDFVLWKQSKKGEPAWDSPWGTGRPGWHLECSAMAMDILGDNFDIHGGGFDLTFPHHENECAQSEAVSGKQFVNYWMHVGFLQIDKEKMSKSLGNFATIKDTLQETSAEVLRYFMISKSYRSPLDYSQDSIDNAKAALERLYIALRDLDLDVERDKNTEFESRYIAAMDDDFNTPNAMAVLFDLAREINKLKSNNKTKANKLGSLLKYLSSHLGVLTSTPEDFLQNNLQNPDIDIEYIEQLIKKRNDARTNKDFAASDAVRDELTKMGIMLEDTKKGTIWRFIG